MAAFRITEIRVTAGKDVFILEPKGAEWVIAGQSGNLPEKLAAKLFKDVAGTAEKYFEIFKGAKSSDFRS